MRNLLSSILHSVLQLVNHPSTAVHSRQNLPTRYKFWSANFLKSFVVASSAFFFAQSAVNAQTPGGVSGAYLWVKADSLVAISGSNQVTSWRNLATAPVTTQASRTAGPDVLLSQANINYNPAITFTGANNQKLDGTFTTAPNNTNGQIIIGVARQSSSSGFASVYCNGIEGAQALGVSAGTYSMDCIGNACSLSGNFGDIPVISRVKYVSSTTTNGGYTAVNGYKYPTCTSAFSVAAVNGNFQIGARTYGGLPARIIKGDIAEVIMLNNSSLYSDKQVLQIESYLAVKYGITLSNDNNGNGTAVETMSGFNEGDYLSSDGSTKFWDGAANLGYQNNVTGIGRDDASFLNQKQSQNANTVNNGNFLTLAKGSSIATSNVQNSETFTNDRSYFMVGDNGGSPALNGSSITITRNGTTQSYTRIGRTWKIITTNSPNGITTLKANVSYYGAGTKPNYLVVGDDANIDASTTGLLAYALDANGQVSLPFQSLPSGKYFTFGYSASLSTLPVKLTAFTASGQSEEVSLTWITASETGTERFEVQRSSGSDAFATIGAINAKSGSSSQKTYTYVDKSASGIGGRIYRLKIVDRDGSVEYSKVISIASMDAVSVKVYPTQVLKGQTITIQASGNSTLQAKLLDASGKVLSNYQVNGRLSVSTDHLNRGIYLLQITGENKITSVNKVIIE